MILKSLNYYDNYYFNYITHKDHKVLIVNTKYYYFLQQDTFTFSKNDITLRSLFSL